MTRTIAKTLEFKGVTPEEMFELYTDPKRHGNLIGASVSVSAQEGAPFSAFDGFVTGMNLLVVPNRLIVQSWRGNVWAKEDVDSVLILSLEHIKGGTRLTLVHANVPEQFEERWEELYWKPLGGKIIKTA